jgi:undecaprenyl-phosphate galactose phosphotransferase/putative colanic acid biosynthesis UDP-glucose lipid carrier transferase
MTSIVREQHTQAHFFGVSLVLASDLFAIFCSSYIAAFAYHLITGDAHSSLGSAFAYGLYVGASYVLISCFDTLNLKQLLNVPARQIAWNFIVSLSIFLAVIFLLKVGTVFSRAQFLMFSFGGLALLLANRRLFSLALKTKLVRFALKPQRIAIVGKLSEIARARRELLSDTSEFSVVETFEVGGLDDTSGLDKAIELSRSGSVDYILVAMPWSDAKPLEDTLCKLREQALPVMLLPDACASHFITQPVIPLAELPAYVVKRAALTPFEQLLKRCSDIVIALGALIVLWPIFLLAAIAIKLESGGPVFFQQRRCGFNNREFTILKFRTMYTCEDGEAVRQVTRNDPRVSKVGGFLRRTSIDELPQLLNVLRGEMAIVGPRPHAIAHDKAWAHVVEFYALRHHIKPGITGLAQVNGCRGETETKAKISDRVRYDLQYIDSWSFWHDIQIIFKTLVVFAFQKSAY